MCYSLCEVIQFYYDKQKAKIISFIQRNDLAVHRCCAELLFLAEYDDLFVESSCLSSRLKTSEHSCLNCYILSQGLLSFREL